jgi:hypothetical protein
VRSLYPKPLAVLGDINRSLICAAPGHVLIGADFSAIESRVLAWVAGEEWKLDTYRRFDATRDARDEPYVVTAAKILGKSPAEVTDDERKQVGKVCDLAFGYQGGLQAFRVFSDRFTDDEVEQFKLDWPRSASQYQTVLVRRGRRSVAGGAQPRPCHPPWSNRLQV